MSLETIDDQIRAICCCRAACTTDMVWVASGWMPLGSRRVQVNNHPDDTRGIGISVSIQQVDGGVLADLTQDILQTTGPGGFSRCGTDAMIRAFGPLVRAWCVSGRAAQR